MFKALTPIIALLVAAGLAFTYVQPTFLKIRDTERQKEEYSNAFKQAESLQASINRKLEEKEAFDRVSLERLAQLIPQDIDEVSIILNLDTLAKEHGLSLANIEIAEQGGGAGDADEDIRDPNAMEMEAGIEEGSDVAASHVDISFSVQGTYEEFQTFIEDLEKSLAIHEVMKLDLGETEGDLYDFDMTIRTFSYDARE